MEIFDLTSSFIIAAINNNSTKKKYEEAIYNKNKFILHKYL